MNNELEKCPCCQFRTISELNNFEVCYICGWEDDGQNDSNANVILGGPNSDYSLSESRKNFSLYKSMYRPIDKLFPNNPKYIEVIEEIISVLQDEKEESSYFEGLLRKIDTLPKRVSK